LLTNMNKIDFIVL